MVLVSVVAFMFSTVWQLADAHRPEWKLNVSTHLEYRKAQHVMKYPKVEKGTFTQYASKIKRKWTVPRLPVAVMHCWN